MTSHYCIKRIGMYARTLLVTSAFLLLSHGQGDAFQQAVRGYFSGHSHNDITIELIEGRGKASFRVNGNTRVVNVGLPMKVSKIPKDSRVKVISEHGTALEIHVEEVPR